MFRIVTARKAQVPFARREIPLMIKLKSEILGNRSSILCRLIVLVSLFGAVGAHAQPGSEEEGQGGTKTVLITGANRGLGFEFARQYAEAGWKVIGTARRPDAATELKALDVRVMQLDVTDQKSVDRLASDLDATAIDLLINNAGIFPMAATLPEIDFDNITRTLAVNTIGPMRVTRALLPNLRRGKAKQIVNITSNLGSIADNTDGRFYGYRESKAALNMFTRSLAAELREDGFTCIVMNPGWVQTDMGGANAPLKAPESISGMRAVIDRLTPADTGTFWTHEGKQMPW
jgi:NAD(P)-dependent dehydrogenase (short-subunit alcohol dehydrogenase family)